MKYIDKFRKFMKGRYGQDELYNFLFKLYIFLVVLNIFIKSNILIIVEFLIMFIMLYRFFSKKISFRKKENQKFLEFKKMINKPYENIKRRISDKEHIYRKCSKCKTILRLSNPSKRGLKYAKCPKCKKRVTFFTLRREKIEIIKDGKKYEI